MIVCSVKGPTFVEGWKEILDLEILQSLPAGPLRPEQPGWRERVIEMSFLRHPEIFLRAAGVAVPKRVLALRQVYGIDLYLRLDAALHLIEVRGPAEFGMWRYAADQPTSSCGGGPQPIPGCVSPVRRCFCGACALSRGVAASEGSRYRRRSPLSLRRLRTAGCKDPRQLSFA
jgi:hypothetical protein